MLLLVSLRTCDWSFSACCSCVLPADVFLNLGLRPAPTLSIQCCICLLAFCPSASCLVHFFVAVVLAASVAPSLDSAFFLVRSACLFLALRLQPMMLSLLLPSFCPFPLLFLSLLLIPLHLLPVVSLLLPFPLLLLLPLLVAESSLLLAPFCICFRERSHRLSNIWLSHLKLFSLPPCHNVSERFQISTHVGSAEVHTLPVLPVERTMTSLTLPGNYGYAILGVCVLPMVTCFLMGGVVMNARKTFDVQYPNLYGYHKRPTSSTECSAGTKVCLSS
jgi:hypothetical protein